MSSSASTERGAAKKRPSGKGAALNRNIHRILALFAALLMLWLGTTGSTIQVLDLKALLTHTPPSDPIQLSIVEGMYGPQNFAVLQVRDFSAAALPTSLDINQAIATVLQAAHGSSGNGQTAEMTWIELRDSEDQPIGQVMRGNQLEAFNAVTGAPVTATPSPSIPQGGRLPPSLRQKLKTLHRFWNRGDTPGVYFEFLSGLVLLTLLITGILMYFRLLSARSRIGRRQWFWLSGGIWRGLHRGVSVLAAVFLLCIAFTGTWIGFESTMNALGRSGGGPARQPVRELSDAEVRAMTAVTMKAMQQLHSGAPIKVIRLRTFGQMQQGVVISGGSDTEQFVFNAETGEPASLTEPSYPKSGFPFGVQVHENIKHFHSGAMFGIPTRFMSLLSGLSVIFLSLSGLLMYFDMWLKRRKGGRKSLIWQ
jgi:uncharacterized iron-regulated membrane protein